MRNSVSSPAIMEGAEDHAAAVSGASSPSSAQELSMETSAGPSSVERLASLIRWVPGSHKELFEAEDKLFAFIRSPHELVHVGIGLPPDQRESLSGGELMKKSQSMLSLTNLIPRVVYSPVTLLDGIAQTVGLSPGNGVDTEGNCYINTLIIGDAARPSAALVGPDGMLCSEDGSRSEDEGSGEPEADEPGQEKEQAAGNADEGAEAEEEDIREAKQEPSMVQRLWAALSPFAQVVPAEVDEAGGGANSTAGGEKEGSEGMGEEREDRGGAAEKDESEQKEEGGSGTPSNAGADGIAEGETNKRSRDETSWQSKKLPRPKGPGGQAQSSQQKRPPQYFQQFAAKRRAQQRLVGNSRTSSSSGAAKKNLVMVHGYAACIGFFFRTFDTLAEHFNIYAIDQLGWGASSRPSFTPETAEEAETWFVEALELWRQEVGLGKFVLLGHSFGGYISSRYALKYPQYVEHLILVGPAGFNRVSEKMQRFRQTWKGYLLSLLWETNMTPQLMIRLLGPWSTDVVKKACRQRWTQLLEDQEKMSPEEVDAFSEYIFQSLLAPMSGELCMKHIFSLGAFARRPLIDSAKEWKAPTTFIYGQDDIMDHRAGLGAAKEIPVPAEVILIAGSGHMLFLEKPTLFNQAILHGCRDLLPATSEAVKAATEAITTSLVPLERCHKIPVEEGSTALFAQQGSTVRLASGWGIG